MYRSVCDLIIDYDTGKITDKELNDTLTVYAQTGKLRIDKDHNNPMSAVRIIEIPEVLKDKSRPLNPLAGKGKSYGDHVETTWGSGFDSDPDFSLDT